MPLFDKFLNHCGWIEDKRLTGEILDRQIHPLFADASYEIRESGRGKRRLLTDYIIKAYGKYNYRRQTVGDCTGNASARCCDILACMGVVNDLNAIMPETCVECIYGYARVEIANRRWSGGDGANGSSVAEACKRYGTFVRQKYGDYDFSVYSGERSREFGERGVPDEIEHFSKIHTVKTISLVKTYYEAIDCLYAGFPIVTCSNVGYEGSKDSSGRLVRDKDGILRRGGVWNHALSMLGFSDDRNNPKIFIDNSWGTDIYKGELDGGVESGFWIQASDAELMLSQNDSFAYSDYIGFPNKLNLKLFTE